MKDIQILYNKLRANYCRVCECSIAPKIVVEFLEREGFQCSRIRDSDEDEYEFIFLKKDIRISYTGNWYSGDGLLEIN